MWKSKQKTVEEIPKPNGIYAYVCMNDGGGMEGNCNEIFAWYHLNIVMDGLEVIFERPSACDAI